MLQDLSAAGVRRAFIGVLQGNESSQRATSYVRVDFRRIGRSEGGEFFWFEKKERACNETSEHDVDGFAHLLFELDIHRMVQPLRESDEPGPA